MDVACTEHDLLASMIRDRIHHVVSRRKVKLLAERDSLDIADTNAALFYPSQFSIAHPASPGGLQDKRKTRHLRHRMDVDETGSIADINKRKRKAADHTENGSPNRGVDSDTNYPWKEGNSKSESQQLASLLSIDGLFSEKDLVMVRQRASKVAVERMAKRRRVHNSQASKLAKEKPGFKGKGVDIDQTASSSEEPESEAAPDDILASRQPDGLSNGDSVWKRRPWNEMLAQHTMLLDPWACHPTQSPPSLRT